MSFSESAPENLGHGAVGEAERERHRLEPAVRVWNPHAPGHARAPGHATPLVTAGGLIVSGALRRRQDLSDACAGYLPDLLRSGLVLLLEKSPHPYYIERPFVLGSYLEQGMIDYRTVSTPAAVAAAAWRS